MKKIPILVNDLIAYIVIGRKELYLAIFNDKKENGKVKRKISMPVEILRLPENKFSLEFQPLDFAVETYISSPFLPTPDKYLVRNFDQSTAIRLLCEAKHDKAVFDSKFEACFTGDDNEKVTFISEEQESYQEVFDEMVRRFFAKSGKKTRKWIPGHRYDNTEKTYYYLGEFLSRKKDVENSVFYNTEDELTIVHFYIENLGEEKTIEEVFKNRHLGKGPGDIKVIFGNLPGCIDSGQKLEPGEEVSLRSLYPGNKNLLEALCFLSPGDSLDFQPDTIDEVRELVREGLRECLYKSWGIKIKEKNPENLIELFLENLAEQDLNICSKTYHQGLFRALGIILQDETIRVLRDWSEDNLSRTFEDFIENVEYFKKRQSLLSSTSYQREGDPIVKIENLYGKDELTNSLISLINYARSNFGEGVSDYRVIKVGKDKNNIVCRIDCKDLLEYLGENISENLKKEILENKFTKLTIYFNENTTIQ